MNRRNHLGTVMMLWAVLVFLVARADDWPQWRGPNRDNVWNETGIKDAFPAGGLKIVWRASVGPGVSSPVVAQGRVFVTDSKISRPTARERVYGFDARTGKTVWTHSYEVDYAEWAFDPNNPFGPRSTPIVSEGRLFTLGARGRLICFEAGTGKVHWEKPFENQSKDSAFTPSPLIEDHLLILVLDGGPPGPCVVALDKASGKEVWRALEARATFASPIVITAAGKRQLIVWTQNEVTSLDPATGKEYWHERQTGGAAYAVATPVVCKDRLLVSGVMYKLDSQKPGASVLWPNGRPPSRQTVSDTSTAMFAGDHLFTCNLSGELVCMDAATGGIVWSTNQVTEAKGGASIHIAAQEESAFLFTDKGELIRANLTGEGYRETGRAVILAPTFPYGAKKMAWVPPAYAGRHVFARSDEELVCVSLEAQP